jgi:hypothetical protein
MNWHRFFSAEKWTDTDFFAPDGFFDASKRGWRYVAYRRPGTLELVDDEATMQRFYRPGLMGMLLKGDRQKRTPWLAIGFATTGLPAAPLQSAREPKLKATLTGHTDTVCTAAASNFRWIIERALIWSSVQVYDSPARRPE